MKLITIDLSDSYLKLLEKSSICAGFNRPEHIRLQIRENLRYELLLSGELEHELLDKKNAGFFDNCINCGRLLNNRARKSHLFHKEFEIFVLRFCCTCYEQFKDITFDNFPAHIIDNIKNRREQYEKNQD